MWLYLLVFFFGAAVGSFVNVLIDRSINGEDWVWGHSRCDGCRTPLAWYDMIPILSYVFYRGRSRCCQTPLSYRYPLVEALVGSLFVWWVAVGSLFFQLAMSPLTVIQPVFWLLTGIFLCILALSDLFYGVVLMPIVTLSYVMTILYRLTLVGFHAYQWHDFGMSLLLSALFFGFFWLLYTLTKGRGMADGDMYVAAYMGLLLGYPKGMVAIMGSFILGAAVGIVLIVTKIRSRKQTVPFVPFMVIAMIIALMWGDQLIRFVS